MQLFFVFLVFLHHSLPFYVPITVKTVNCSSTDWQCFEPKVPCDSHVDFANRNKLNQSQERKTKCAIQQDTGSPCSCQMLSVAPEGTRMQHMNLAFLRALKKTMCNFSEFSLPEHRCVMTGQMVDKNQGQAHGSRYGAGLLLFNLQMNLPGITFTQLSWFPPATITNWETPANESHFACIMFPFFTKAM